MVTGARDRFETIGTELAARRGATLSAMFGMPALKVGGKAFAGLHGDDMVFKLTGEPHASALGLAGSHLFDPMGGRPMKEWVAVPRSHDRHWTSLAEAALDYVASGARGH